MSGGTATIAPSKATPGSSKDGPTPSQEADVTLPPIIQDGKGVSGSQDDAKNPFTMPPDRELFTLREKERQKQKEERSKDRLLRVHEKGTYRSRMNDKLSSLRKALTTNIDREVDSETAEGMEKASRIHKQTQFVLAKTRDRRIEKEDLTNYIGKKREMFLLQYSLGVKRDEIQKLEEITRTEENKLESAEKYLEQSATMFDEFLKENDKNSVEAIKMAEAATKAKLEKVAEIKRLNAQIVTLKSEISRNEDILNELKTFRGFLNELAPEEWHKKREEQQRKYPILVATDDDEETMNKEELYFTDPVQLLDMFTELEEQNLSLIQNGQETEEALEEMRHNRRYTENKMENELEALKKQVDTLQRNIEREERKGYDLETKSKLYSFGEFKAEDQESMLHALDKKVTEVYNKCIGGNEATVNALQMLAAIEGRMEELFEELENLPAEKVESAEKTKEKERRLRLREQKLVEQRQHQEERLKRALERSQADPKKRVGRKLIYRSEPPVLKRKTKDSDDMKEREEEELQYFFS